MHIVRMQFSLYFGVYLLKVQKNKQFNLNIISYGHLISHLKYNTVSILFKCRLTFNVPFLCLIIYFLRSVATSRKTNGAEGENAYSY